MAKSNLKKIIVQEAEITFVNRKIGEYISLTDISKYRNSIDPFSVINNWMRNRSTIEFLGLWEKLNNPDFKPIEFDRFRKEAGSNYFVLSPQRWIGNCVPAGFSGFRPIELKHFFRKPRCVCILITYPFVSSLRGTVQTNKYYSLCVPKQSQLNEY